MISKNIFVILLMISFASCKQTESNSGEVAEITSTEMQQDWKVNKTAEQWRQILTEEEFYILREAGTERPFTSELLDIKKPGTFICAGCNNPLYETEHKFDSGTGWPSFDRAIDGALAYDTDMKIGYQRDELLCGICGGHLGHVFNDGPRKTTGKRHCINGDAMDFVPATEALPELIK
jgi:peptide-methionine (R)-S-oxide reductase